MQPAEQGVVEVPLDHLRPKVGIRWLAYQRFGTRGKAPAIFLHGGPGHPTPIGAVLASPFGDVMRRNYDVVYFEQRGAGASLNLEEYDRAYVARHHTRYTMAQHIADLEVVRRHFFGAAKVTLVGSSWGGYLGLGYAAAHPEAIQGLILGSFESTTWPFQTHCENLDRALQAATLSTPALAASLQRFRAATASGTLVWHKGQPDAYRLVTTDMIEIAEPFAGKARYAELAGVLDAMVADTTAGREALDGLSFGPTAEVSMGGSLPGTATFCQELISRDELEHLVRVAPPALYCDPRAYAQGILRACQGFGARAKILDQSAALAQIQAPALLFAGRLDPLIDWQNTARDAARMPHAGFVLIDGPHTPIKEGGACFAAVIEDFARTGKVADQYCPATALKP